MAKAKALTISLFFVLFFCFVFCFVFVFCFFMCLYLYGNGWRFRAKSEENR